MAKPDARPLRGPEVRPKSIGPYVNPVIGVSIAILMTAVTARLEEELGDYDPGGLLDKARSGFLGLGLVEDWDQLLDAANEAWDLISHLIPSSTEIAEHLLLHPPRS